MAGRPLWPPPLPHSCSAACAAHASAACARGLDFERLDGKAAGLAAAAGMQRWPWRAVRRAGGHPRPRTTLRARSSGPGGKVPWVRGREGAASPQPTPRVFTRGPLARAMLAQCGMDERQHLGEMPRPRCGGRGWVSGGAGAVGRMGVPGRSDPQFPPILVSPQAAPAVGGHDQHRSMASVCFAR